MYYLLTKDDCPWCNKAIEHITDNLREEVRVYNLDDHPMLVKLMLHSGLKTVPQIWVNNIHIGGYSELVAKSSTA